MIKGMKQDSLLLLPPSNSRGRAVVAALTSLIAKTTTQYSIYNKNPDVS